jgi:hypothetical protein
MLRDQWTMDKGLNRHKGHKGHNRQAIWTMDFSGFPSPFGP